MSRIVPAPDALVGKRFDVAVAKMLGISRSKAADLVDSGQARVLGREVARSSTLQAGETVEFDLAEEQAEPEPIATDMAVVYEDDDVVVEHIHEDAKTEEKENEDGTKQYVLESEKDVDLRKIVFNEFAKENITIFEMKKADTTLEDAFMKLIEGGEK